MLRLGIAFRDVHAEGYHAASEDADARAGMDMPEDSFSASEVSATVKPALAPADPLDVLAGRTFDEKPASEDQQQNSPEDRLQAAFNEARVYQRETVKLETGKMTVDGAPGAKDIRNGIEAKAGAAENLKAAVQEVRQEQLQAPLAAAPQGGGKGVAETALSAAAGVAAEAVIPGSGVAMAVLAIGAGTFGAQGPSHFASPSSGKKGEQAYHTAAGYDGVDVMKASFSASPAAAPVTSALNDRLSRGPGFGMGAIEHILEPSLEDTKITFNPDQLTAMAAMADRMKSDAQAGRDAYRQWRASDLDVTQKTGDVPVMALKLGKDDELRLTSDNPALREEPLLRTPKISAATLGA